MITCNNNNHFKSLVYSISCILFKVNRKEILFLATLHKMRPLIATTLDKIQGLELIKTTSANIVTDYFKHCNLDLKYLFLNMRSVTEVSFQLSSL